jgi:hypothetical protein
MPPPNDYVLPADIEARRLPDGSLSLSEALVNLLVFSRSDYYWPRGTGARESQQAILTLEADVGGWMQALNEENAHHILTNVSAWAGNNADSHKTIVQATPDVKEKMLTALLLFNTPDGPANAIDALVALPGIRLVIASKTVRFCCRAVGAVVDRHTSYFFNSLEILSPKGHRDRSTNFRREWPKSGHTTSRLAIYNSPSYFRNRHEFVNVYLPLLGSLARSLNAIPAPYHCAATGVQKNWRPTDVEMAAYFWGAYNGARRCSRSIRRGNINLKVKF